MKKYDVCVNLTPEELKEVKTNFGHVFAIRTIFFDKDKQYPIDFFPNGNWEDKTPHLFINNKNDDLEKLVCEETKGEKGKIKTEFEEDTDAIIIKEKSTQTKMIEIIQNISKKYKLLKNTLLVDYLNISQQDYDQDIKNKQHSFLETLPFD